MCNRLTRPITIVQCKKRIALDGLHYVSAACVGGVIKLKEIVQRDKYRKERLLRYYANS